MTVTVQAVRGRVETDLDDSTLQRMVNAAVKSVDRIAGKAASETLTFDALGNATIGFYRRVNSITTVTERRTARGTATTLAADDYRLVGAYKLLRLNDGTNAQSTWGKEVVITFVPEVDQDVRDRVAIDLVNMAVEFKALDREKVGDYEQEQKDYNRRRTALLREVNEGRSLVL